MNAAAKTEIPTMEVAKTKYAGYLSGGTVIPTTVAAGTKYEGGQHYTMSGTYARTEWNSDCGYIEFDLTKGDAVIYIAKDDTVTMGGGLYIKVTNANNHKLIVMLDEGASLKFSNCTAYMGSKHNNIDGEYLGPCGILSCPNHNTEWNKYTDAPSWSSSTLCPTERMKGRYNIAVPGQTPACYILGVGNNYLELNRASVVDAYVSLCGTGADASTIFVGECPQFYGRLEAVTIDQGASDDLVLLDCPAPGTTNNSNEPLTSCYSVKDYQYYYGTI
jgi:hypothetical protein